MASAEAVPSDVAAQFDVNEAKGGKLLPPSSEDNTCVARKCIPYFLAFILNTCARAQN